MKKTLTIIAVIAVLLALTVFIFKEPITDFVYAKITEDMFVSQDNDSFSPGPALGSPFPTINAMFDGEKISSLDRFSGSEGTVFVASRSFDWCPYCMRQLIELQANKQAYEAAGLGLVAITYDTPELQQAFINKHGITIPVLSDIEAQTFATLGILNAEYQEGDNRYGLPYPGMIVVDKNGKVAGKLFVEAYSARVDAQSALTVAVDALNKAE